jgi:hypothetical protein
MYLQVLSIIGKLTKLRCISEAANALLNPIFGGNLPANVAAKMRDSSNASLFFLRNLRGMDACNKTVQDLQALATALGIEDTVGVSHVSGRRVALGGASRGGDSEEGRGEVFEGVQRLLEKTSDNKSFAMMLEGLGIRL